MFMYQGIIPALKYMVTTSIRYQIRRFHISLLVVRKPAKAEQNTISEVPRMVLDTVIRMDWPKSGTSLSAR